jgi:hypothetical protein
LSLVQLVQSFAHGATMDAVAQRRDFWIALHQIVSFAQLEHGIHEGYVMHVPIGAPRLYGPKHHVIWISTSFLQGLWLSIHYDERCKNYHLPVVSTTWSGFCECLAFVACTLRTLRTLQNHDLFPTEVPRLVGVAGESLLTKLTARCERALWICLHSDAAWLWTEVPASPYRCLHLNPDGTPK